MEFHLASFYNKLAISFSEKYHVDVNEVQEIIQNTQIKKRKKEKGKEEGKEECSVCCEEFNSSTKKKIECLYCGYIVCRECTERYLLSCTPEQCMKCKKPWNREFLDQHFTRVFINGQLKKHQEDILVEREMGFLPNAQIILEQRKERDAKIDNLQQLQRETRILFLEVSDELRELNALLGYGSLHDKCKNLQCHGTVDKEDTVCRVCNKYVCLQCNSMKNGIADSSHKCNSEGLRRMQLRDKLIKDKNNLSISDDKFTSSIRHILNGGEGGGEGGELKKKREFIRKCPNEKCRGFLSTMWKCGMCEKRTCKECYEIKERDDHKCKPENVETAKLIAKDSKPCPKCGIFIFKIEGCSQMWCIECKTAWDWNTGQITTIRVHNPHYYEWMRREGIAPREHGDEVCGGLPPLQHFVAHLHLKELPNAHRFTGHARHVLLARYRVVINPNLNQDLQFKYLEKEIDKEKWKSLLVKREKSRLFRQEIYDVINMFVTVSEEMFRKLNNDGNAQLAEDELKKLRSFANEQLKIISKRYVMTTFIIDDEWNDSSYKHGLNLIKTKIFYNNGNVEGEGMMKNGQKYGKWYEYHENGMRKAIGTYKNGKKNGKWWLYDDGGQYYRHDMIFKNDIPIR